MNSYQLLSAYYDRFTDDVGYEAWADYFEKIFKLYHKTPETILDLACGTGTMTKLLADRGYHMIGVDASEEMLAQAYNHVMACTPRPLLIHQRMENLELAQKVDACICCLDSINYVTDPKALQAALLRVAGHLAPDGLFIFDINTPLKFERIANQSYVREDGDVYCVWQCLIEDMICTYDFDIFENTSQNLWTRYKETHQERIYTTDSLQKMLQNAGLEILQIYPELSFDAVTGKEDRLFFCSRNTKG